MSWTEGRLSYLAGAQFEGRELLRQVEAGTCGAYTRDEVLEELRDLAAEERRLRARRPAPALPPAARQPGASRRHRANSPRDRGPVIPRPKGLRPRTHRRVTVKFIPAVIAAADVAVVIYVEKVLMAGRKATAGHPAVLPAAPKELIIVGLVFALPALVIVLAALLRSQGSPPPASRPRYTPGDPR